jgi:hypothetical protein
MLLCRQVRNPDAIGMRRTRYNTPTAFWVDRVYRFARDEEIDLNELRVRLRRMTDDDLLRHQQGSDVSVAVPNRQRFNVVLPLLLALERLCLRLSENQVTASGQPGDGT